MLRFLFSLMAAGFVFILMPDAMVDRLLFKPLPEKAIQIGRTRPPSAQEEPHPILKWRSDMSAALWAMLGGGEGGGRFELTYEGTRLEKEGQSRITPGQYVRPDKPVWMEISSY